jgi:tRNA 2-thiouridine synthesizing protein E
MGEVLDFPYAHPTWSRESAEAIAKSEGLKLTDDHWELIRALQEYFNRNWRGPVRIQPLHDALEEKFHHKGGLKYLYTLFPGGPVAQGCRLAGLNPPAGASDKGFGSAA